MIIKQITSKDEARKKLKVGVDQLADTVKSTLGPGGKNVILDRMGVAAITKDGISVASEIFLGDFVENIGAQIVKESASKTAAEAGDGTTTATVLAQAIFNGGVEHIEKGANAIDLKRGIDQAAKACVEYMKKTLVIQVRDLEQIKSVARISSNNDPEITDLVSTAIDKVGEDGLVLVEDAHAPTSDIQMVDGFSFERGYMSDYFVTDRAQMEVVLEKPIVLIYQGTLEKVAQLAPLWAKMQADANLNQRPVLFVAEDFSRDFIETMAWNHQQNKIRACCVQSPDFGEQRKEMMKDIAAYTDSTIIAREMGLTFESSELTVFGSAYKVKVTQWKTTIIADDSEDVLKRRADRETEIKGQMLSTNDYALTVLKQRLSRLMGQVCIIHVGAQSEIELKEKKDRIDDAIHATRAAKAEGIVPGGGVTLLRMQKAKMSTPGNDDERIGQEVLLQALAEPLRAIATNVGKNSDEVLNSVLALGDLSGFDARTFKYVDMVHMGIIDPAKVVRLALENAASVAGMLLTTDYVVTPQTNVK